MANNGFWRAFHFHFLCYLFIYLSVLIHLFGIITFFSILKLFFERKKKRRRKFYSLYPYMSLWAEIQCSTGNGHGLAKRAIEPKLERRQEDPAPGDSGRQVPQRKQAPSPAALLGSVLLWKPVWSSVWRLFQFNFVGRLLGPRGNSLKRVEACTGCRVYIRGQGSIKDPGKVISLSSLPFLGPPGTIFL